MGNFEERRRTLFGKRPPLIVFAQGDTALRVGTLVNRSNVASGSGITGGYIVCRYYNNFGKLENGRAIFAPKPIIVDGEKIWTNREDLHRLAGYFPVVRTDMPFREGFYYTEDWQIEGEVPNLVEHWVEHALETEP
jgi:hypothetical protein